MLLTSVSAAVVFRYSQGSTNDVSEPDHAGAERNDGHRGADTPRHFGGLDALAIEVAKCELAAQLVFEEKGLPTLIKVAGASLCGTKIYH
jgi:hypothetical protein